jgi:hypothetical protein
MLWSRVNQDKLGYIIEQKIEHKIEHKKTSLAIERVGLILFEANLLLKNGGLRASRTHNLFLRTELLYPLS